MTFRLFHSSKKIPKQVFTILIEVTISKNCSDHFCEIDWIKKMTLRNFIYADLIIIAFIEKKQQSLL